MMLLFFSSQKSMDADSSLSSGSQLVHCGYEMTEDELECKFLPVLPGLMPEDCNEPASVLFSSDLAASSSQLGCVSSCGSSLLSVSRSSRPTLVPPLVSLPPLYTSSTQHQPESISAELSSGVTLTCIYDVIIATNIAYCVSIVLGLTSVN